MPYCELVSFLNHHVRKILAMSRMDVWIRVGRFSEFLGAVTLSRRLVKRSQRFDAAHSSGSRQ